MKQIQIILILLLCSLIYGCRGDEPVPSVNYHNDGSMKTRAAAQLPEKCQSETNPELITNWENVQTIVLNTIGNGNTKVTVTAPWAMGAITTGLSTDFCTDIKKENGWTMLFHTLRKEGLEQHLNYLVFYNLFTGFFKVFYYNEQPQISSSVNWSLNCANSTPIKHSLLEMVDVLTPVEGEYADVGEGEDKGLRFNNLLSNQYFVNGWNGFQFQVSRYEEYPKALSLALGGESVTITNYEFNGALEASIQGNIVSTTAGLKSEVAAIANLGGDKMNKWLEKIRDNHLKPADGNSAERQPKTIVGKIFSGVLNSLTKINGKDLIVSGLKLFFGKSLFVETPTIQEVKLTQSGKLTMTGTSTTIQSTSFLPLRFNLSELYNPDSKPGCEVVNPDFLLSDFKGLGVWTIPYTPIVYYNPVTRFVPTYVYQPQYSAETDIEGFSAYPEPCYYDFEIIFNPFIEKYIEDYSVDVEFVETDLFTETNNGSSKIMLSGDCLMDNHLYYPEVHHEHILMKANVKPNQIDPGLRYFYEWDTPGNRRTVAMITVGMKINYMGNRLSIKETRAYKTESCLDGCNYFPPANGDRAILINALNPRIISTTYQGSAPTYEP